MLLKGKNGISVLKSICKIIETNKSKITEMINCHPRVLSNSIIIFYLLTRKHQSDQLLNEVLEKAKKLVSPFSMFEKNRLKMKTNSILGNLKKEKIIDAN